jgi:choline-sulfatase
MSQRSNVLILMSDEHRADVAGHAGDEVVRTPTLDWLAEGGVTFNNAYTPSPICVPARQCILAGQYPRTCGCEGWIGLADGYPTYATRFGQYGYHTVAFGKLHLQGPDQLKGFQSRPVGDVACGVVRDPIENAFDGFQAPQDDALNCPGSMKWSDEKELRRAGPGPVRPADRQTIQGVCDWIDERLVGTWYDRHTPQRPALLQVGLHDPHYPYICREDLFSYYLPRVRSYEVEVPFDHPFLGLSPWPPRPLQAGVDVPERAVRRGRAAYYAMVEGMDAHCGQVLDALRHAGEDLDDWTIVYLSDHGDQLGEHGVWEKQKFFEGSVRAPLIIRAPRHLPGGTSVNANVSLCDLFPTLCELAGLEIPPGLDGRSLVSVANGGQLDRPDEVCSFFLQQGFRNVMIKSGALKYQWYEHEERGVMPEVLFDLDADPLETRNAIDEPHYADALAAFRRRRKELGY